jgi:hypothetical protein
MMRIVDSTYSPECFKVHDGKIMDNGTKRKVCIKKFDICISRDGEKTIHLFTFLPGFISDGASIPYAVTSIICEPWDSRYITSYLIHDCLYGTHYYDRKTADRWLSELLLNSGMSWWKCKAVYVAVDLFGEDAWNATDKHDELEARRYILLETKEI